MSLDHAILGYLNYAPASGYELKRKFDLSVQHFWPANQSQIYRTLSRLSEKGFVEMEVIHQEDRPDRKEYYITDAGQEELSSWLHQLQPFTNTRSAALIQVFFGAQLTNEEVLKNFEIYREKLISVNNQLNNIPNQWDILTADVNSEREKWFWNLTVDLGQRSLQANLDWVDAIIESIRNGEIPEK